MPEPAKSEPEDPNEDIVITSDRRLVGCRGRVLVAVLLVIALILFLTFVLVRSLLSDSQPLPGGAQAATEAPPESATRLQHS